MDRYGHLLAASATALLFASGIATTASAQTTIEAGLTARTTSPGLLGSTDTTTIHADSSRASGNQTDTESWPSAQNVSSKGIPVFRIASAINTTLACSTGGCNEVSDHLDLEGVELLGPNVSVGAVIDDVDFNLIGLGAVPPVTMLEVMSIKVNGVPQPDVIMHVPAVAGDTPPGTTIPVDIMVSREVVHLIGLLVAKEMVAFHGELDFNPPQPDGPCHEVAVSLKGHLDGMLLTPPADIDIAMGDVHVYPTATP